MIYAKNLPLWERCVRIIAGVAAIAYGWIDAPSELIMAIVIASGAVLILTSLFGFCPACAMIGRRPLGQ